MKKILLASLSLACLISGGLRAADLNVADVRKDEDASVLLRGWAADIGYTATISDSRKVVFLKDGLHGGNHRTARRVRCPGSISTWPGATGSPILRQ